MKSASVAVGILVLALTTGCQDPRLSFAGTWKGPSKTIVRFSDGSSQTYPHGEATIVISAPERSNQITFNGPCGMTATVNDERTFTLNKKACPSERISFPNASGTATISCDFVETVNGGTGTRATTALSVSYFGDSQLTHCTQGADDQATYTTELTLSEQ